jgi:hypothetical protein
MTTKIIHQAAGGTNAWAHTDNPVLDSLRFMAKCPSCQDGRFQQGYGFRTLVRRLVDNRPIEGYCAACNESWPINAGERAALAWRLLTED